MNNTKNDSNDFISNSNKKKCLKNCSMSLNVSKRNKILNRYKYKSKYNNIENITDNKSDILSISNTSDKILPYFIKNQL